MFHRCAALATLALVAACSSGKVSGTVTLLVLSYDTTAKQYTIAPQEVTTLQNLQTLQGSAARIEWGGKLTADLKTLVAAAPKTQRDFDQQLVTAAGSSVDFSYFMANGVVHPLDADGLAMATTYYNFEQAQLFFLGLDPASALSEVTVQVAPTIDGTFEGPLSPVTDDAFSEPFLHEFSVQPNGSDSTAVSPDLQLGVVGHKYAHAVFQQAVFPGGALPWLEARLAQSPTMYAAAGNIVRTLDEGLADYFGATIANDPEFIRTASGQPFPGRQLDVTAPRCLTSDLTTALQTQTRDKYDPYPVGSVLSALLWDLASARSDLVTQLNQSLLDGLKEFGTRLQKNDSKETLGDALDALASKLPGDLKARACGELFDRFHLTREDIPSCTTSRTPEQLCAPSP